MLGGLGLQLDGPDDIEAARDAASALELARQIEATEQRLERAARQACTNLHGQTTSHHWEGSLLVCNTPSGPFLASTGARP